MELAKRIIPPSGIGPELAWAANLPASLPAELADADFSAPPAFEGDTEAEKLISSLRELRAFTDIPPISSRLPISYRRMPGPLRVRLARLIGRWQGRREHHWADFPGWPLDLSTDILSDWLSPRTSPFRDGPTPVVLTHDLDSAEGTRNLLARFLDLEEASGARSTNFVVPAAWPLDHGALEEVKRRGHELAVHGFDHSNRTAFSRPEERRDRLAAAGELIERYAMVGYRAPSLLRTRALLKDLSNIYLYDSSIPTSGGPFPTANNGCATARPFLIEGIAELPLTMPRDGTLRFLGLDGDAILALWRACADQISEAGGVVVLLTHCEETFSGGDQMLDVYKRFLEYITSNSRFRWSSPMEIISKAGLLTKPANSQRLSAEDAAAKLQ